MLAIHGSVQRLARIVGAFEGNVGGMSKFS